MGLVEFDKKVDDVISLLKVLQKGLDYETELKILDAPRCLLNNKKGVRKLDEAVKIKLVKTFTINYTDEKWFIKHAVFSIIIKQSVKGVISTSFSNEGRDNAHHKEVKKLYKLLLEAYELNQIN